MNTINAASAMFRAGLLSAAVALAMLPQRVSAQEMDHSKMNMPMPAEKKAPEKKTVPKKKASKPAAPAMAPGMDHSKMHMPMPAKKPASVKKPVRKKTAAKSKPAPVMDHSAMDHDMPIPTTTVPAEPMDHSKMGHDMGNMPDMQPMDHSAMPGMSMAPTEPITPIPVLTDADRAAAVPPAHDHPVHDNSIQSYVLLDRLETWNADNGSGLEWEGQSWIGTDLNRLWLRSEGERIDGHLESADLEVLYGHSFSPWWDVVTGVRHDFKPGGSQDFAAIGVIGLAPYKFEVAATAYVGDSGQTAARAEVEYETLLTNRLILQPLLEVNLYGKDDARRGIGSGLSTVEAGLRLRYEFTRQFAPYIGIVHERAFGGTADFRRGEGEDIDDTRFVAGLRIWF
jgi:copper resistance protein B